MMTNGEIAVRIIEETARKYGITAEVLKGKSREAKPIAARHEACFRLREEADMKYRLIAKALGWKPLYSTIASAIESHKERLEVAKIMLGASVTLLTVKKG